jgi:fucose permease
MKYPTPRFFAASVFLALASLVGLVFSHSLAAILVFVALFGLGYSNLFAIIFSVSMQRVPEKTNEVSALLIVGVCGGAVIPPVLGVVTDSLGSQVWAVAALALVWVYLVFLIRHIRKLA